MTFASIDHKISSDRLLPYGFALHTFLTQGARSKRNLSLPDNRRASEVFVGLTCKPEDGIKTFRGPISSTYMLCSYPIDCQVVQATTYTYSHKTYLLISYVCMYIHTPSLLSVEAVYRLATGAVH